MKYKSIRGMEDILPPDIYIWRDLEKKARIDLESYGYVEIRTPVIEDTSIFVRSIGEDTDIVTKEMYTFKDKKGRSLTLRPEGTAPIVRAYIEHSLDKISPELKLYYIGPMFRSERPQKGRSRQFHQIGVEVIGSNSYLADAEVIMQMSNMLRYVFKLNGFKIKLNSLGCKKDKEKFSDKLRKYLKEEESMLCQDCKTRIKKNVLRVLDCKKESCVQVARNAPNILESLCLPCEDNFKKLKTTLTNIKIKFEETKNLVRGLDYYTGTVFEVTHPDLGAQDAIGAGGRYDNLTKDLGGPTIGAVGYALGMERIIMALKKEPRKVSRVVYIATIGDEAKIRGIQIAEKIRIKSNSCLTVLTDIKGASLKSQMRSADKNKAKLVVILGQDELKISKATIRDMAKQEQIPIKLDNVVEEVIKRMGL